MKKVTEKVLLLALLNVISVSNAETIPSIAPVDAAPVVQSGEINQLQQHPSALVVKYVRNVTVPNGFGESKLINDAVFYSKNGDVKVESGDKLEYAIVITPTDTDLQDVSVKDFIPPYTEYIPDSTMINNVKVADIDGKSRVLENMLVNDAGSDLHSGIITTGKSAIVIYRVRVNLMLELPENQ